MISVEVNSSQASSNIPNPSNGSSKIPLVKLNHYPNLSKKIDPIIMDHLNKPHLLTSLRTNQITQNPKIPVYIHLQPNQTLPSGIKITGRDGNTVVAILSQDELNQVANSSSVQRITLPDYARSDSVTSQGVSFSHADLLHAQGLTGQGITVAVIDDSFFTSDPEISGNIISSTLFDSSNSCGGSISCGKASGDSHGTAVAQTVVDMAPNVKLRLYVISTSVDFDNAVDDAITHNVNIITTSINFPTAGGNSGSFRDGTSAVAQKVNTAKSDGIFVVTSASNDGVGHWKGTYIPSPITPAQIGLDPRYQSVMDFQPSAIGIQRACLPVTDNGFEFLATWNAWPSTFQDYDFYLFDRSMSFVPQIPIYPNNAYSIISQSNGPFTPIETFTGDNIGSACLVVASWSSTQNHFFHIYGFDGVNQFDSSVNNRFGSIGTPADASGAFAVGAINYATDSLESFSSSGPTDDSRLKPEICGPDGTATDQSSINPFFGTSASAPHVAGAAALLLQQNPSLTPDQLKQKFINLSRFNSAYSQNNLCGGNSGALSLQSALVSINLSSSSGLVGSTTTVSGTNFTPSSVITLAIDGVTQTTTTSDSSGSFSKTITIPSIITGSHTISATDSKNNVSSTTYTVTACIPPGTGDWTVSSSCTLSNTATAPANVIVQSGSVLTIPNGLKLNIDFTHYHLLVKSGGGVLIKSGGTIK